MKNENKFSQEVSNNNDEVPSPSNPQNSFTSKKKASQPFIILGVSFALVLILVAAYFFFFHVNWTQNIQASIELDSGEILFPNKNYSTRVDTDFQVVIKNHSKRSFSGRYVVNIRDTAEEVEVYKELENDILNIPAFSEKEIDIIEPIFYIPNERRIDADGKEVIELVVTDKKGKILKSEKEKIEFSVVGSDMVEVDVRVEDDVDDVPEKGRLNYVVSFNNASSVAMDKISYSIYLVESGQTTGGDLIESSKMISLNANENMEITGSHIFSYRPLRMDYSEQITAKLKVVTEYNFSGNQQEHYSKPFKISTSLSPYNY